MFPELKYLENIKKSKANNQIKFKDYLKFVIETHKLVYNEEFIIKPFHVELAELFTKCAYRELNGKYIVIANMPFRFSKTQMIIYYIVWCFLNNAKARFIYGTYSEKLSLRTSREVKMIYCDIYKRKGTLSKDSAQLWETHAGGGLWATTIQGAVTGFGAGDLFATPFGGDVIIDDPQKASDSFYETKTQTTNEALSNTFWSRRNQIDKVPMILVQQRLSIKDSSAYLMEKYPNSYLRYCIKGLDEQGNATFPERVSAETLLDLKFASPYTFYSQVQQEPQAYSGNFFLVDRTQVISVEEFRSKEMWMKYWVRSWDFAGVKKETKPSEKNDFTRGVLTCTDGQNVYIVDLKSHKGTVDQNDTLLVKTAHLDGWKVIITVPEDPGSAGQHYVDYLQNIKELGGYTLHSIRPTQNKQLRAAPFAAFLNKGNVIIVSDEEDSVRWNSVVLEELASFPFGSHDDIVDSLSDSFHMIHSVNKFI